jgi:hypothetical protein
MISLHDLRAPAVALDWHEAVAAGAALGALLAEAKASACPQLADVALLPSGDLRVTGPGLVEGPTSAGVARALSELLESAPCPAELRQLVERYAASRHTDPDGPPAVADVVSDLAFFERPGRREVLAELAQRAALAIEQDRRTAALDALTERTRLAAGGGPTPLAVVTVVRDDPGPEPAESPARRDSDPADSGSLSRPMVPVAVGILAFLTVAYVAAAWFDRPTPPRTVAVEDELPISGAAPPDVPVASPAVAAHPRRPGPPAERERPSGDSRSTEQAAGPTASRGTVSDPAAAQPKPVAPSPLPRAVDVLVAERAGRVVPSPVAPVRPAPPHAASTGHVFQTGDAQVTPAVLIRPHLPDSPPPDVPEEQIGTLEFVVGENGAVEHVHLVSPANRYQERMLVAAAKTWQFRPATRDGRPVRYRTRIRVTL